MWHGHGFLPRIRVNNRLQPVSALPIDPQHKLLDTEPVLELSKQQAACLTGSRAVWLGNQLRSRFLHLALLWIPRRGVQLAGCDEACQEGRLQPGVYPRLAIGSRGIIIVDGGSHWRLLGGGREGAGVVGGSREKEGRWSTRTPLLQGAIGIHLSQVGWDGSECVCRL